MKKLEDIPKQNIFEVPDGYFDQLALKIQARTEVLSDERPVRSWSLALRYVVPAVLLVIAAVFIFRPKNTNDTEHLLASIPSEHLIAYLHESEISEGELLEAVKFDHADADSLSAQVINGALLNDIDADEYKSVLENEL